jgi:predicted membrane-bound spermidine synthase
VTVVEKDPDVIQLFEKNVLPQFTQASKLHLVKEDAFIYAEKRMAKGEFDFIFTDLWHDPSDGVELYLRMKSYERYSPRSSFRYWIEKTLRYYC